MTLRNEIHHLDLHCPHCGLGIHVRAAFLAPEACPRCLAQRRVAQPLHAGPAPQPLHAGPPTPPEPGADASSQARAA